MHSRIYQISEKPISKENFTKESSYYDDGFVGEIADYVSEVDYRSNDYISDLEWLQTATEGLEVNIKKGTITILNKKEYFDKKHDKFKELIENLQDITLEDFSSNKEYFTILDLKSAYDDKYSFYIDDNYENVGLTSLDNWVRNAEENKKYYVGNILDYHF